jgi:AP2 domain
MKRRPPNRFEHRPNGTTVLFIERPNGDILECVVDTSDFSLIQNRHWTAEKRKHTFYAKSEHGATRMHRLLFPDIPLIDHQDGNGLNNRRKNLRRATHPQNAMNTLRKRSDGRASKYRGVVATRNGKFGAAIQINGHRVWLGTFDSETQADAAYRRARKLRGGNFAP